jgi:hypothetical protein
VTKEAFVKKNFKPQTLTMIKRANAILEEYAEQNFTLTVRQLFYQFVARDMIENTFKNYKLVGRTVKDGRRAGLIDWDHIEDRGRELEEITTWGSPEEHIAFIAKWHHEDLWASQKYRPEVWIEKSALIGVIEPACDRWRVPHTAVRGHDSHTELYLAGKRFASVAKAGQVPIVFHLGDHDPSGLHATGWMRDELALYAGVPVRLDRSSPRTSNQSGQGERPAI